MPLSGMGSKDQVFKCMEFNCGCEFRMGTPPQKPLQTFPENPLCLCGTAMKRWPQAALRTDQYNDV